MEKKKSKKNMEGTTTYIEKRNGVQLKRWVRVCEVGYSNYIKAEKWDHNFDNEGKERVHCEASYLSKMVFSHLFKLNGNNIEFGITSKRSMSSKNNEVKFYFDIMNNPKVFKKDDKRLGNIATKEKCNLKFWEEKYHTIGNFAPIPSNKNGSQHFQFVHNNNHERWDLMLEIFRKNWSDLPCLNGLQFEDYMKSTFQHLYYKKIFEEFKREKKGSLDELNGEEWYKKVREWNKEIKPDDELINFDADSKNIQQIVDDIVFLIEARGQCIVKCLKYDKKQKETLK